MAPAPTSDPIASLNRALSEVLDDVQAVKQAHRKVSERTSLHVELDQLFTDLVSWAGLLVDADQALGVSPLTQVSTAAGRVPANRWTGSPSEEEVRSVIGHQLERLDRQLEAAMAAGPDESSRAILASIRTALEQHLQVLAEKGNRP